PDVPNTDTEKQAPKFQRAARIDLFEKILGGFASHSLQTFKLALRETVKIGHITHQTLCDELIHKLVAEAVNFHCSAACQMKKRLLQLCRTGLRKAAAHSLAFLTVNLTATNRAT